MAIETLGAALRQIDRLFIEGTFTGLSDVQLLERFVTGRDAAAFETLVARHGPMVLSVCRGILRDPNDAEDAFQATFLVLVKKAATIRCHGALGGWLHLVAHRVALEANAAAARRRAHERQAGEMAAATRSSGTTIPDELLTALHEEIARLPERFRIAVVLCDLEGISQAQAAGQLRWSERTLRRRLAQGRDSLKRRLGQRGLPTDGSAMGALLLREATSAIPSAWLETTARAALAYAQPLVAAGVVSAAAHSLTQEVLRMMLVQKLKLAAVALLAAGAGVFVTASFAVGLMDRSEPLEPPRSELGSNTESKMEPPKVKAGRDSKPVPISGIVVDPDGKPVSGATIYVRHNHWYDRGEERRSVEQPAAAGPDGRFTFDLDPSQSDAPVGDGPPWHAAMIAAVAPGYGPSWTTAGDAANGGTELRLARDDRPIRGRILDSQGRGVAGATVRVERIALTRESVDLDAVLASGKLDWDGMLVPTIRRPEWSFPAWIGRDGSVATGADGRFELTGLGRDRVAWLRIERQGLEHGRIAVLARATKGPRRPPGQPSPTFDSLNGELGLELYGTTFEHVVGPTKPITGVVRVKGTGQPVGGFTVAAQVPGSLWSVVMTTTDERGHFRLDGLPKAPAYRVDVRAKPGALYLGMRPQTVTDTAGLKPIEMSFELTRGVAVQGRLVDKQTGRAVPCDWVQYFPLPNNPHQGNIHGTSSGVDHTFRITVPTGGGMIVVKVRGRSNPYPGARLAPADRGKLDVKGEGGNRFGIDLSLYHAYRIVEFPAGTESAQVDLEVASVASRQGKLIGPTGRPAVGASAMGLTTDPFASTVLEGDSFEVEGLRPDELRLVEFRHGALGVGGAVTVDGSLPADKPLVVELARYATIAGRLFDDDKLPLMGAKVSTSVVKRQGYGESDPLFRPREAVTDREGRFRVEGINPALSVHLWIHKPGDPPFKHKANADKDLSNITTAPGEALELGDIHVRFSRVQ